MGLNILLSRTVADMTYRELQDHLDECELSGDLLDLDEIEAWLTDIVALNLHKRSDNAETLKKLAHLALVFIDLAREPKGVVQ